MQETYKKHKVFISYHHQNDQYYKDQLVGIGEWNDVFVDRSVDTGDIPDHWTDEQIRKVIRDKYLRDSTVTILLAGTETKNRKHVDWELHSSMYDGTINKKSGILVITLPEVNVYGNVIAAHGDVEKLKIYPEVLSWTDKIDKRDFAYLPQRILDNLTRDTVKISVVPWYKVIGYSEKLKYLIDITYRDRKNCNYDFSSSLRRRNS